MKTEKEYNKIYRTMVWWMKQYDNEFLKVRRLNRKIEKLKKELSK